MMTGKPLARWTFSPEFAIVALLLLRVLVLLIGPGILSGDGFLYLGAAQHVAQTGMAPPASVQSRSFSVLLAPLLHLLGHDAVWKPIPSDAAVTGNSVVDAVHWLQILFDLVVVWALLRVYLRVRPANSWAFRAGYAVIALQPITAAWTNMVLPDTLAMFGFFLGMVLLARSVDGGIGRWAQPVGGLLLGLAGFLRVDLAPLAAMIVGLWLLAQVWQRGRLALAGALGVAALFVMPAAAMMTFQYASQGDARYIVFNAPDNPGVARAGYFAWVRAWMMTQSEFRTYAFDVGTPGWRGFDIKTYPARAFTDPAQRGLAAEALADWQAKGYGPSVDARFQRVADALRAAKPLQRWVTAPGARTAQLWVNPDGGAAINFAFDLKPPRSWIVAGMVGLLKLLLGGLALWGSIVVLRSSWRAPDRIAALSGYPVGLAVLSLAALLGRAAEMWLLNIAVSSAVMESRYVIEVWPCTIVLAMFGFRALADRAKWPGFLPISVGRPRPAR